MNDSGRQPESLVLVADDDPMLRLLSVKTLEKAGFDGRGGGERGAGRDCLRHG